MPIIILVTRASSYAVGAEMRNIAAMQVRPNYCGGDPRCCLAAKIAS